MKVIRIILLFLILLVGSLALNQYFFCPYYSFPKPRPFSGGKLYNPYAGIDSGSWHKCNFHAHSNAWFGVTNGDASPTAIWDAYDSLGYAIHCVSEYQKIDTTFGHRSSYIPAYEHGYNQNKTHQLVLGSSHVTWVDYLFPQTLSNKQHVLDKLKQNDSTVVVLNHPQLRKGYNCKELNYLSNYQCMEVLNPSVSSFSQWDAALSSGHPVFIIGNDDTHHINNPYSIGRECTWLNFKTINGRNVLSALKKGQGYAMVIPTLFGESFAARTRRIKSGLPFLKVFHLEGDTLNITMSKISKQIDITGQEGNLLAEFTTAQTVRYVMRKEDHYVRTSVFFEDGTAIFLNPVFRYDGDPLQAKYGPTVNQSKTVLFILLGLNIVILCLAILYVIVFADKWKKRRVKYFTELRETIGVTGSEMKIEPSMNFSG